MKPVHKHNSTEKQQVARATVLGGKRTTVKELCLPWGVIVKQAEKLVYTKLIFQKSKNIIYYKLNSASNCQFVDFGVPALSKNK